MLSILRVGLSSGPEMIRSSSGQGVIVSKANILLVRTGHPIPGRAFVENPRVFISHVH